MANSIRLRSMIVQAAILVLVVGGFVGLQAMHTPRLIAGLIVVIIGLAVSWLLSERMFRPLDAIAATASRISGVNLRERIDVEQIDIELAELAGVLNATFDRLEATFDRQSRFTADASHELRTPLAVIRSQAELTLSRSRSSEDYRKALQVTLRAAERMTDLVERLLILARADAGWPSLQRERVRLDQIIHEVVTEYATLAETRGVKLTLDLLPTTILGDATTLAQVAANLIANAIQYNRTDGSVRIRLKHEPDAVVLIVSDTGVGIAAEEIPHLFERFYRVDKSRSRLHRNGPGGTGLGLAICQAAIEVHAGEIGVTSIVGEGTKFWVRLPRIKT